VLEGADRAITAIIDRDQIATCGISLGGWTGLRMNSLDRRSKATFIAAPSWGDSGDAHRLIKHRFAQSIQRTSRYTVRLDVSP
jgi:cephalosporin-C deacetylase-like acetyl esterase